MQSDQLMVLRAIDLVLSKCLISQTTSYDAVVEQEALALQKLRESITEQWPLPQDIKNLINIGPVAAKNISDWNDELANALMILDHVLKNDGDSLSKLVV